MSSILNDVKHSLGLLADDPAFDTSVIMHTNTAIADLTQLGVGPIEGFRITGVTEEWSQFADDPRLSAVQSYIYLKVKLLFDPPTTGFTVAAYERQLQEMAFRINVVVDYG